MNKKNKSYTTSVPDAVQVGKLNQSKDEAFRSWLDHKPEDTDRELGIIGPRSTVDELRAGYGGKPVDEYEKEKIRRLSELYGSTGKSPETPREYQKVAEGHRKRKPEGRTKLNFYAPTGNPKQDPPVLVLTEGRIYSGTREGKVIMFEFSHFSPSGGNMVTSRSIYSGHTRKQWLYRVPENVKECTPEQIEWFEHNFANAPSTEKAAHSNELADSQAKRRFPRERKNIEVTVFADPNAQPMLLDTETGEFFPLDRKTAKSACENNLQQRVYKSEDEQQLEDIARKDKDLGLFLLNAWVWVFSVAVACGIAYVVFKTLLKWLA